MWRTCTCPPCTLIEWIRIWEVFGSQGGNVFLDSIISSHILPIMFIVQVCIYTLTIFPWPSTDEIKFPDGPPYFTLLHSGLDSLAFTTGSANILVQKTYPETEKN